MKQQVRHQIKLRQARHPHQVRLQFQQPVRQLHRPNRDQSKNQVKNW